MSPASAHVCSHAKLRTAQLQPLQLRLTQTFSVMSVTLVNESATNAAMQGRHWICVTNLRDQLTQSSWIAGIGPVSLICEPS